MLFFIIILPIYHVHHNTHQCFEKFPIIVFSIFFLFTLLSLEDIKCPTCRQSHPIPKGGVKDFPNNLDKIQLVELVSMHSKPATISTNCQHCDVPTPAAFKCSCEQLLCDKHRISHTSHPFYLFHRPVPFPDGGNNNTDNKSDSTGAANAIDSTNCKHFFSFFFFFTFDNQKKFKVR